MKNPCRVFTILLCIALNLPLTALAAFEKPYEAVAGDAHSSHPPQDQSDAAMMHTLFDGSPELASGPLDLNAYVPVEVQRLDHPAIAYVNWKALGKILRHLGFANPPQFLTPELEDAIFQMAGFAMRVGDEEQAAFRQEFRRLYAIRYGGRFLNFNFGDGRGASSGYVQIKGVGKTPLVRPQADDSHSSGVVGLPEAIHEALWAAIFQEELPLGADPVLFIITTGTKVDPNSPNTSDDRALVIRADMNRPGYYERNTGVFETADPEVRDMNIAGDQERMEAVIQKIARALPFPVNVSADATPVEYLQAALNQFIDNVTLQYAAAYARQIFHGATSTSNIVIDGRFLDFGTSTAVRGYGKMKVIDSDGANGETTNIKSDLIFEMLDDLYNELPDSLKSAVPTNDEAGALVDELFNKHVLEQFLVLAGTPQELAVEALTTPEGKDFAEAVLQVAQAGNDRLLSWSQGDVSTVSGTYNLGQVLQRLIKNLGFLGAAKGSVAAPTPMSQAEWSNLNLKASKYYAVLSNLAADQGIAAATLKRAVELGVSARNTTMDEVRERPSLWRRIRNRAQMFGSGSDPFAVQNYIDKTVTSSVHEFKSGSYKIDILEGRDFKDGMVKHRVLNLKTGREQIVVTELPGHRAAREFDIKPAASCGNLLAL